MTTTEYRRILLDGYPTRVMRDGDDLVAPDGRRVRAETAVHLPPVEPSKIIATHLTYRSRVEEFMTRLPPAPTYFHKPTTSLNSHGGAVVRPAGCRYLNYEGEIAIVIGREGRHIPRESALAHIAGYTIVNDGSARDWQKQSVAAGKNFDASSAMGPWLVTTDEIGDPRQMVLTTRLDGEVMQHSPFSLMAWDLDYLVHYVSTFTRLRPGDVISTGTPGGVGARRNPPRYVRAGEVIEVEVTGIGTLRNQVADEAVD